MANIQLLNSFTTVNKLATWQNSTNQAVLGSSLNLAWCPAAGLLLGEKLGENLGENLGEKFGEKFNEKRTISCLP